MKLFSATAALASFVSGALAAPGAAIYTYAASSVSTPSSFPTLSPANARLILADQLGLAQYHSLETADEDTLTILAASSSQKAIFEEGTDEKRKVFLFFDGVADIKDVLPEEDGRRQHIASLSAVPSLERNRDFVEETLRLGHNDNGRFERTASGYVFGGRRTDAGLRWEHGLKDESASRQVEEITKDFNSWTTTNAALRSYHFNFPSEKQEYKNAAAAAADLVKSLARTSSLAKQSLVVVAATRDAIKATSARQASWGVAASTLSKRSKEAPLISLADSAPSRPVLPQASGNSSNIRTTMERCSKSEKDCNSRTNSCSGHGKCHKRYGNKDTGECWVCQCTATRANGTAQYWGGPACQKQDISVQFWLFAGFGILGTATLAWGIGLLYGMGQSQLPSVLGAGVAPSNRK